MVMRSGSDPTKQCDGRMFEFVHVSVACAIKRPQSTSEDTALKAQGIRMHVLRE